VLQEALSSGDGDLVEVLAARGVADRRELASWVREPAVATAAAMVDAVVARGTPGAGR